MMAWRGVGNPAIYWHVGLLLFLMRPVLSQQTDSLKSNSLENSKNSTGAAHEAGVTAAVHGAVREAGVKATAHEAGGQTATAHGAAREAGGPTATVHGAAHEAGVTTVLHGAAREAGGPTATVHGAAREAGGPTATATVDLHETVEMVYAGGSDYSVDTDTGSGLALDDELEAQSFTVNGYTTFYPKMETFLLNRYKDLLSTRPTTKAVGWSIWNWFGSDVKEPDTSESKTENQTSDKHESDLEANIDEIVNVSTRNFTVNGYTGTINLGMDNFLINNFKDSLSTRPTTKAVQEYDFFYWLGFGGKEPDTSYQFSDTSGSKLENQDSDKHKSDLYEANTKVEISSDTTKTDIFFGEYDLNYKLAGSAVAHRGKVDSVYTHDLLKDKSLQNQTGSSELTKTLFSDRGLSKEVTFQQDLTVTRSAGIKETSPNELNNFFKSLEMSETSEDTRSRVGNLALDNSGQGKRFNPEEKAEKQFTLGENYENKKYNENYDCEDCSNKLGYLSKGSKGRYSSDSSKDYAASSWEGFSDAGQQLNATPPNSESTSLSLNSRLELISQSPPSILYTSSNWTSKIESNHTDTQINYISEFNSTHESTEMLQTSQKTGAPPSNPSDAVLVKTWRNRSRYLAPEEITTLEQGTIDLERNVSTSETSYGAKTLNKTAWSTGNRTYVVPVVVGVVSVSVMCILIIFVVYVSIRRCRRGRRILTPQLSRNRRDAKSSFTETESSFQTC